MDDDVQPADCVGPYVLECHLARGGMGDVWRARREGTGGFSRRVALKRIHPELVTEDTQIEQFLREARLGSWLQHPNVVPILDVGLHNGTPYLVMELVEGVDAKRLTSRGERLGVPIPPALAGYIVHQTLCALEAGQSLVDPRGVPAPVVHRDISPENILIGRGGDVKVADFGLAKRTTVDENLTHAGVIKGKISYMSPEQLMGQPLDARSDLYSVGVTFYEMLCGRRPYDATNPIIALERCRDPVPHPLVVRPGIPEQLAELAVRWRGGFPDERGASIREARERLETVLQKLLSGVPGAALAAYVAALTRDDGKMPAFGAVVFVPPGETRCAKCGGKLQSDQAKGGLIMDRCHDCQGVWLEAQELLRIVGGEVWLSDTSDVFAAPQTKATLDGVTGDCPRCHVRLRPYPVASRTGFHVERCPQCRGMWFDAGELEQFVNGDVPSAVRQWGGLGM